jgi:hypothetical protein
VLNQAKQLLHLGADLFLSHKAVTIILRKLPYAGEAR